MLNYFRGGPHHNEIVHTDDLLSSTRYAWIDTYYWTKEVITGSESGTEARVWQFIEK